VEVSPHVANQCTRTQKANIHLAIKKNDVFLVRKYLAGFTPMESLQRLEDSYTCFHAAAEHNAYYVLPILIDWVRFNKNKHFMEILNIPNRDGNTPAMLAAMNDHSKVLQILHSSKAIDYNCKNLKGETFSDICLKYCSKKEKFIGTPTSNETLSTQNDDNTPKPWLDNSKSNDNKTTFSQLANNVNFPNPNTNITGGPSQNDAPAQQDVFPVSTKVTDLINQLKATNSNFIDPEFRHHFESICLESYHEFYHKFVLAYWRRPHEIFGCDYNQIKLFDNIDPNDILQGILGVCYLLSAVSALAEFPERLKKIFVNEESNPQGVYGLKFYVKGIPTEVIIDDYFPVDYSNQKQPLFSRPRGNELWVLLVEKAWAKIFKNYVACEGGYMDDAFEYLLGCPSIRYRTWEQTEDEIWQYLSEADKKNYVICAATHDKVPEGLVQNHAYALLSVHEVSGYRIIKLRNPFGELEWKGDFSDDSPLWTDEIKAIVGYTRSNDGVFCMTVQDFRKYFDLYSIARYEEGWKYGYREVESDPRHAEYFKFKITKPTKIYFRIHQTDTKLTKLKYSPAELTVAKIEADGTYSPLLDDPKNLDEGLFSDKRRSAFPTNKKVLAFKPGEYILRTKVSWRNGKRQAFTLSTYSDRKVELEPIPRIKDFKEKLFINIGQQATDKKQVENNCSFVHKFYGPLLYAYFENKGTRTWKIDVNLKNLSNLRLLKKYSFLDTMKVEVPPGQRRVVFCKKLENAGPASYDWSWNYRFE